MYYIEKTLEISACHRLKLSYESKCQNLHGHNWIITVYCKSRELNSDGMVVDFTHIKQLVQERLDHANLNEVLPFNPTAENIASRYRSAIAAWCRRARATKLSMTQKIKIADNNVLLNHLSFACIQACCFR